MAKKKRGNRKVTTGVSSANSGGASSTNSEWSSSANSGGKSSTNSGWPSSANSKGVSSANSGRATFATSGGVSSTISGGVTHGIVVGVDFGTTYAGVAYIMSNETEHDKIELVQNWPGKTGTIGNTKHDKAPTEISYSEDLQQATSWGYQLSAGADRYGCFKLLLDAQTGLTNYDDPSLRQVDVDPGNPNAKLVLPLGKSAMKVTEDYLRFLYNHLMDRLQVRMRINMGHVPIKFVLTTPAIWSHEAQEKTKEAAKRAGFATREKDSIMMISEPEAAATFCMKEMHKILNQFGDESAKLKVGERFVVLDAGGGTVDLITYIVCETEPNLRVKEAAVGNGGKCGSTMIDRHFLKFLKKKVGEKTFNKLPASRTGRGGTIMKFFEGAKRDYGQHSNDDYWLIPVSGVPDDPANGIEDGEIKLTPNDMYEFFDPTVNKIIDLVNDQINRSELLGGSGKIKNIFLVGGFGESTYLYNELKTEFMTRGITVVQPSHSWTAIARGAVLHGQGKGIVTSRKLKIHYGVDLCRAWRLGDDEKNCFVDQFDGKKWYGDHVSWFAEKGEEVTSETRINVPYTDTHVNFIRSSHILNLYGCRMLVAPEKESDPDVFRIGSVRVNLTQVPKDKFEVKMNHHGVVYRGTFDLKMIVGSADIRFDVNYEDKCYGSTSLMLE